VVGAILTGVTCCLPTPGEPATSDKNRGSELIPYSKSRSVDEGEMRLLSPRIDRLHLATKTKPLQEVQTKQEFKAVDIRQVLTKRLDR
jgi:hypothetical protein